MIPGKMSTDDYFGARRSYINFLRPYGDILQVIPSSVETYRDLLDNCKLLVLPGGADISPIKYGSIPSMFAGDSDPYLEYYDSYLLPMAIGLKIPILGICRGFQSIITYFGGKLIQHLPLHPRSEDWVELAHKVSRTSAFGKESDSVVNSLHHQGISVGDIPECLVPIAYCRADDICEGVTHRDLPILGLQWHPEVLPYDFWVDNWIRKLLK